jgi:hypothetical protein
VWGVFVDGTGDIYVASEPNVVTVFAPDAGGASTPLISFATSINAKGLWVDGQGNIYLAGNSDAGAAILRFTSDAGGSTPTPSVTISGPNTGLVNPTGLTLDVAGNIWVADSTNNSVLEFTPDAGGDAWPLAIIRGPSTSLASPEGVAVDSAGYVYVIVQEPYPTLGVFCPGANGNASPLATLQQIFSDGAAPPFQCPTGVGVPR